MSNNYEKSPCNVMSLVLYIFPLGFYVLHWNWIDNALPFFFFFKCTFLLNNNKQLPLTKLSNLFQHQDQLFKK